MSSPSLYSASRIARSARLLHLLIILALALTVTLSPAPATYAFPAEEPPGCTVVGWGLDISGETTPPAGLSDVTAIAAGGIHGMALKADGTVVVWGENGFGQSTPPGGLSDVVAIAAGAAHSLVLKSDGTVVGWGSNQAGQTTVPAGLSDVVAIAAGWFHSLALKADGTVVGWGRDGDVMATPPVGLSDVVAISAGREHSLALKSDGTVVGWGYNDFGQVTPPAGLSDVVAIAAGQYHNLALKADGTVVGWGYNGDGQATPPAGLSDVVALAGGGYHSLALQSDGTVVGWGFDGDGQATPPELSTVTAIAAGESYSLALQCESPADTTAPTISISTPSNGATYALGQAVSASYSCADEDGGSGLASCVGTVPSGSPIDTGSVGSKSFTVTAADNAGNTTTLTHNYTVAYSFSGFFAPVDNLPVVNKVNGGQSIPVKFSLGGNYGLGILAPGYPASQRVACDTGAPVDLIEETTTANQGLTYAGSQYTYVWKTQKSWAGTCRLFTLRLTDGTDHVALFSFK